VPAIGKRVPADGMSAAAIKRTSARPGGQLPTNLHDISLRRKNWLRGIPINLMSSLTTPPHGEEPRTLAYPHCADSCAASRTMAAPSFETGAMRRLRFSLSACTCALLRMRRITSRECPGKMQMAGQAGHRDA